MIEEHELKYNKVKWRKPLLISTATEGMIRYEWAVARYSQVIPVNWQTQGFDIPALTAIGYSIDDAYNTICKRAIEVDVEWLMFIEDDVILPPDAFLRMSEHMDKGKYPVVSGLYYTKSEPAVPLIFRGRGNGAYAEGWEIGDKVMCDGLPMGFLLIHMSIIKYFWDNLAEPYRTPTGDETKQVFLTPRKVFYDPETISIQRHEATQDLYFFDRMIENDVLAKTGWDEIAKEKYPLLCDTCIYCKHIDRNTGRKYPA